MFDLIVKNVNVVRPNTPEVKTLDIAIKDGKFAHLAPSIDPSDASDVVDGAGLHAFPGVVDAHMHLGIYHPLAEDIVTETRSAATGGVTSGTRAGHTPTSCRMSWKPAMAGRTSTTAITLRR
jgi:allantoinase